MYFFSARVIHYLSKLSSFLFSMSSITSLIFKHKLDKCNCTPHNPSWTEIHAFEDPWKNTCKTLINLEGIFQGSFKECSDVTSSFKGITFSKKVLSRYVLFHALGTLKFEVWKQSIYKAMSTIKRYCRSTSAKPAVKSCREKGASPDPQGNK